MAAFPHRFFPVPLLASLLLATLMICCAAPATEPSSEKRARRDRFGDALPQGAIYRVGASRFRVGRWVYFLAFSPDGQTLLSINHPDSPSSLDSFVRHWDASSGIQRRQFSLPQRNPIPPALSPDGKLLAVPPDLSNEAKPIALVDAATGRLVRSFGAKRYGHDIAFSPDGRTLAAGESEGAISFWDPTSGKSLGALEVRSRDCRAIAFSPDGKHIAAAHADHTVRIWDKATLRLIWHLQPTRRGSYINAITFSPDNKLLAAHCDDAIELWSTATGERVRTLSLGSRTSTVLLAFSPDGKRLAASHLGTIRLWDTNGGKEVCEFKHPRSPTSLAFSPDGKVLATGDDNIHLWQVATGQEIHPDGDKGAEIDTVAFSPDGRLLATGGQDEFIRLWDADTGALIRPIKACPDGNRFVSFSPDSKAVFSRGGNHFVLWDCLSGNEVRRFQMLAAVVTFGLSPSGRTLAWADAQRTVHFQDLASGKELRTWHKEKGRPIDLHPFSSPEERLAAIALFNAKDYAGLHRDGEKRLPASQKGGGVRRLLTRRSARRPLGRQWANSLSRDGDHPRSRLHPFDGRRGSRPIAARGAVGIFAGRQNICRPDEPPADSLVGDGQRQGTLSLALRRQLDR